MDIPLTNSNITPPQSFLSHLTSVKFCWKRFDGILKNQRSQNLPQNQKDPKASTNESFFFSECLQMGPFFARGLRFRNSNSEMSQIKFLKCSVSLHTSEVVKNPILGFSGKFLCLSPSVGSQPPCIGYLGKSPTPSRCGYTVQQHYDELHMIRSFREMLFIWSKF